MSRRTLVLLLVCLLGLSVACSEARQQSTVNREATATPAAATQKTVTREEAIATAQKAHAELDRLETAGDLEGQAKYFSDNVVRMDAFRPITRSKQEWLALQRDLRSSKVGFKVQAINTKVLEAWQEGDRLYEYGQSTIRFQTAGGGGDDPIEYFMTWRVNPATNPQAEFIIWNTTQPVEQLRTLATASVK